jgi:hypothetical protein
MLELYPKFATFTQDERLFCYLSSNNFMQKHHLEVAELKEPNQTD